MIETKQLEYFVKCAELESFSKAAEELHTTQPNVSKVIRSLEDELELELFLRQKNGIILNANGRDIYKFACNAMHNLQQIKAYAVQLKASGTMGN